MTPIGFRGQNVIFAKDQPEYVPLPAMIQGDAVITCWKLSWWERIKMFCTGHLWIAQLTFRQPLQPQLPTVHYKVASVLGKQ